MDDMKETEIITKKNDAERCPKCKELIIRFGDNILTFPYGKCSNCGWTDRPLWELG